MESLVRARGADGGGFAVALDAAGLAWLGGPLAQPYQPLGSVGVLVGAFAADGAPVYVASIDGPYGARVAGISVDAESGLLAFVASAIGISVTDGVGGTVSASTNPTSPILPSFCAIRLDPSGKQIWPLHCDPFGGIAEAALGPDGAAVGQGYGQAVQAPTGAVYPLGTNPKEIMAFLAHLTPTGEIADVATVDPSAPCEYPSIDLLGAVFCDVSKPGEDQVRTLTRVQFLAPHACPL